MIVWWLLITWIILAVINDFRPEKESVFVFMDDLIMDVDDESSTLSSCDWHLGNYISNMVYDMHLGNYISNMVYDMYLFKFFWDIIDWLIYIFLGFF